MTSIILKGKKPMFCNFAYFLFNKEATITYPSFHKSLQCFICFTDSYVQDFQRELSNINKSTLTAICPATSKFQKLIGKQQLSL